MTHKQMTLSLSQLISCIKLLIWHLFLKTVAAPGRKSVISQAILSSVVCSMQVLHEQLQSQNNQFESIFQNEIFLQ